MFYTCNRALPKGLWINVTSISFLSLRSTIILTTPDFLTSSTWQWLIEGILMCLHLMEAFVRQSRPVLSPSWTEWESCPRKSWWLGSCQIAKQTQGGRNTWENSKNTFQSTSSANVDQTNVLGRRSVQEGSLASVVVCWRGSICSRVWRIFGYSNIFEYFPIRIFLCIIFVSFFLIRIYSHIHSYCFFYTNIFGYSFVSFLDINIFEYSFVSKIYIRHTLICSILPLRTQNATTMWRKSFLPQQRWTLFRLWWEAQTTQYDESQNAL